MAYVVPCVRFNDVVRSLMTEICVPVSRLIEVAVIPASTPRFSLTTVSSLTCFSVLLHHCNTRYEWLVRPCSTGTFTLQETPSFAWRTNGVRYPRVGGTRQRHFAGTNLKPQNCLKTRRLPPVGCTRCWAVSQPQSELRANQHVYPEEQT